MNWSRKWHEEIGEIGKSGNARSVSQDTISNIKNPIKMVYARIVQNYEGAKG